MSTRTKSALGAGAKSCGLLIRRPQVQSLLGPPKSKKQNRNTDLAGLSLRALRERFGVTELMAVGR